MDRVPDFTMSPMQPNPNPPPLTLSRMQEARPNAIQGTGAEQVQPGADAQQVSDFGPAAELAHLRFNFPFLPILPPPAASADVVCDGVTAVDVEIPDGTLLIVIASSAVSYANLAGRAVAPVSVSGVNGAITRSNQIMIRPSAPPEYIFSHTRRQISVLGSQPGTVVNLRFYQRG